MTTVFQRPSLREALKCELRDRILKGRIASGSRFTESELSLELSVSRTPLREALIALEHDGFLACIPGRGFSVVPLTKQEIHELYPIIAWLETLALKSSPPPSEALCAKMRRINAKLLSSAGAADEGLDLDREWHALLLEACPNTKLMEMIRQVQDLLVRYEYAYRSAGGMESASASDHEAILDEYSHRRLDRAGRLLGKHWLSAIDWMEDWIEQLD